jgi:hypothetical protein
VAHAELRLTDGPSPGPQDAVPSTPQRQPGSVRRTTTIDSTRPDGLRGRLVVDVRGQDVVTAADGSASVADRLDLRIELDGSWGTITAVDPSDPSVLLAGFGAGTPNPANRTTAGQPVTDLGGLVGVPIRGGYGRRLAELLPDDAQRRTLLYSALEDLSAAVLVSGYSPLHAGLIDESFGTGEERAAHQADICIGWANGSPLVESLRATGVTAVPYGPPAPTVETDDPHGWHAMEPLATYTVRRRRRLDVVRSSDEDLLVDSHFRDSCALPPPDVERVMHEYLVDTTVAAGDSVSSVAVQPRVLPWYECPGAVASAQQIVGTTIANVASRARKVLVGPSTCTHLTSTLRCLADVHALAGLLPSAR